MTRTRARRLTRTTLTVCALTLTVVGGVLTGFSHPALGAVDLGAAVTCLFAAWLIGGDPRPRKPPPPPQPREGWRTDLEVARFRAQISEWEANQKAGQ